MQCFAALKHLEAALLMHELCVHSSCLQAQHMVMDTLALLVSASANYLLRYHEGSRMMLPLIAFPLCSIGDLYCIYRELKAVELVSLNKERSEMIAERWLTSGQVGGCGNCLVCWLVCTKLAAHSRP